MEITGGRTDADLSRYIGSQIRKSRKMRGLTQEEFARRMGTQRPAVSNWENGINVPGVLTLKKMADILEIPIRSFLEEDDDSSPQTPVTTADNMNQEQIQNVIDRIVCHERQIVRNGEQILRNGEEVDRGGEQVTRNGEQGHDLFVSWRSLLEKLDATAEMPHGEELFSLAVNAMQKNIAVVSTMIANEEYRQLNAFLCEIGARNSPGIRDGAFYALRSMFVPPVDYLTRLQEICDGRVLVLTGRMHSGKTCVGLRMLLDLALTGYRPFFLSGRFKAVPRWQDRLSDMIRDGNAVLLDDVFSPNTGLQPIKEFLDDPAGVLEQVNACDAKLIITTESDRLRWSPEIQKLLKPFIWCMDNQYSGDSYRKFTFRYSLGLHPQAKEPIDIPVNQLKSPHEVAQAYSVPTDNRQIIRRRAQTIHRHGMKTLLQEDFAVLDEPELALLFLVRYVPVRWMVIADIFNGMQVSAVDGGIPSADEVLTRLGTWVLRVGYGESRIQAISHPSYIHALDEYLMTEHRAHRAVLVILQALLTSSDLFRHIAAIRITVWQKRDNVPAVAACLKEYAPDTSAGKLLTTLAAVLEPFAEYPDHLQRTFRQAHRTLFSDMVSVSFRWIRENLSVLPQRVHDAVKWTEEETLLAQLLRSYEITPDTRGLGRLLLEASDAEDPFLRILAVQQSLLYASRISEETCSQVLERAASDTDDSVVEAFHRVTVDHYSRIPAESRHLLLNR